MTPEITTALITVAGMLLVAILGAIVQISVTKQLIGSEFHKVSEQITRETGYRRLEARSVRLLDAVAELLAEADPEANAKIS